MPKKQFESLSQFLQYGSNPLARQLMVWMMNERERAGPWVIRMTTEGDGMPVEPVYHDEWTELDPNLVDNLVQTLTEAVQDRHGGTPDCSVRFQAYHKGEAKDHKKHIHRNQRIQPTQLNSTGLAIGTSEFAWNALVQQQQIGIQKDAQLVAMAAQMTVANAALTNQLSVVATNRAALTGGADVASNGWVGIIGMLAAVTLGPKLVKMMSEGDSLLSLDGINLLTSKLMGNATEAAEASHVVNQKVSGQITDYQMNWDEDPDVVDVDYVDVDGTPEAVPAAQPGSPKAVLDALAGLDPADVKAYLKGLKSSDPTNEGRQWLKKNGMGLATVLN